MTRFGEDYEEWFPNQGELWWANLERAMSGRKGQRALRDLRDALHALPEKKLISGRIADEHGGVCAVGALVCKRRVDAGEKREEVLAELAALVGPDDPGELETGEIGVSVGVTFCIAWRLGYLNDEDHFNATPEERYDKVLDWVDSALLQEVAA